MSSDHLKSVNRGAVAKGHPSQNSPTKNPTTTAVLSPVAPLFRRLDWLTALVVFIFVLAGYIYTLAPDLTLEDSGELAVGSFYAGVPHPPGYPVWTLYTWLFTVLVPISNIAYRVALSSAVSGALSCALLALIVSRGSSMMLEGITGMKQIEKRWEDGLCLVAGFVAGCLLGFNGFMWSQAVIVEVYVFSVLSLMLLLCALLRWMYAPHQLRYLYLAFFWFGICITNHQTLIVAAMGLEVAILMAAPRLGRDLFIANTLIYIFGLIAKSKGIIQSFDNNPSLFFIFNAVGVGSGLVALFMIVKTMDQFVAIFTDLVDFKFQKLREAVQPILIMGAMWAVGAAFYFYMPIASMTNPPMNWGYPRTEEGFWHALTRGQYDKTSPTSDPYKLVQQLAMYVGGAVDEFTVVCLLIALVPFMFLSRMQNRERGWMIGLTAIYIGLAFLLLILLNPGVDRQASEQARVFFTASHVMIAIWVGYGITLIGGLIATHYVEVRRNILFGTAIAAAFALYSIFQNKSLFFIDKFTSYFLFGLTLVALVLFLFGRTKVPRFAILCLFALLPLQSILAHWSANEQRGHLFGNWFGHDMFSPPFEIYPEMPKSSIVFGGTDPGRFCPTYMIFCESFIPAEKRRDPKFDRRDCYLITQNALADGTYLSYIRAHYNRSAQNDPPFFVNFLRSSTEEEQGRTNLLARLSTPLDSFFTRIGKDIEDRRRREGVYPPKEILTPTPEDSQIAFQQYIADAQRRLQHDMQFPTEPKQIRPGEDVRVIDNKISVSGQVAVMAINGLLTKVIFDKNPDHEFFVEESFALDWMFPYLSPFGIIMKINREPLVEITQDMVKKDHDFWAQYSDRLIGNWMTYETSVQEICAFAEKTYLHRDLTGFKGDPKFVRDDNAQKAFSKLRSAQGGLYFWRVSNTKNVAENQRMLKEAEFALSQSFAFCPFSPEAVYKYVNLLVNLNRAGDAELVARTCLMFDPESQSIAQLADQLKGIRDHQVGAQNASTQLAGLEQQYQANPTNLEVVFKLASAYVQLKQTNQALKIFDQLVQMPTADARMLLSVAQAYSQLQHMPGLEMSLGRIVKIMPDNPEAWFDYARAQVMINNPTEALKSLGRAISLSQVRLLTQPTAKNLLQEALADPTFVNLRNLPEFKNLVTPQ